MPIEIGLEMYADRETVLPFFTGHISRGLLLHILRNVKPSVSQDLHELDVVKPYSVTPLYFRSKMRGDKGYIFDPSYPCHVKFRFLTDAYFQNIVDYFSKKNTVLITDAAFQIASMTVKSKDYLEMEQETTLQRRFRLHFKTPTYLAVLGSDFHCLWPDPLKIFPNLMRLWNDFSTARKYSKEEYSGYKEWLTENLGVAEHELSTQLVHMGKRKVSGFTGWATYEMKTMDEWNKTTCTLAKFAEYSNIGGNRTGGFGEVKLSIK